MDIIKCMNKDCNNYKQELENAPEVCPLCGRKTEIFISKVNNKLAAIVSIVAIACIVAPFLLIDFVQGLWGLWFGYGIGAACIVGAFISRSLPAIVISILSLLAGFGMLFYFLGT